MKTFAKRIASFCTAMVVLLLCAAIPQDALSVTLDAEAAGLESVTAKDITTKETYTMRIWLAHQEMGDELESRVFYDDELFFCYSVKDSSGNLATSGIDFTVTETITGPSGSAVWTKTHSSSEHDQLWGWKDIYGCYNYTVYQPKAYGEYNFTAVMYLKNSTEPFITCSIDFSVKKFAADFRQYVSLSPFGESTGDMLHPIEPGSKIYVCYEFYDTDTNEPLGDRRSGYDMMIDVILPDGTTFETNHADSEDSYWCSYTLYTPGEWKAVFTLGGTMTAEPRTVSFYIDPMSPIIVRQDQTFGADKFIWGVDNWDFDNNSSNFTTGYAVDDDMMERLLAYADLPNIDREMMRVQPEIKKNDSWGGSCYGTTMSEILVKQGMLDPKKDGGLFSSVLHDNITDSDTLSFINFFYYLQYLPATKQIFRNNIRKNADTSQAELVAALDKAMEDDDCYINFCFSTYTKDSYGNEVTSGAHSVLAYGKETGSFYVGGKEYTNRILIADPNNLEQDALYDMSCLYYNADGSWIFPDMNYTRSDGNRKNCYWNAEDGSDISNGEITDLVIHKSAAEPTDLYHGTPEDVYFCNLRIYNSTLDPDDSHVYRVSEGSEVLPDSPYFDATDDDSELYSESWSLKPMEDPIGYEFLNKTGSYINTGDFDVILNYRNDAYFGKLKNVSNLYVHPLGYIEVKGTNMKYDLALVSNEGNYITDWYSVSVSGSGASHVSFQKHAEGYVIKSADDLTDITVYAYNLNDTASLTFSTDYTSALIYEIDKATIGVKVDTDGDGEYETALTPNEPVMGDANNDGKLTVQDAVLLYHFIAEDDTLSPAMTKTVATSDKIDMDSDGILTLLDLNSLFKSLSNK